MMWLTSVVFPEDSGPKISTIRPRGTPPIPRARSRARAPVGIASTGRALSAPSRISAPWPKSRSIWVTAASRAASFALASFAEASFKAVFLSAISLTSLPPVFGQLDLRQRGISRTLRLDFRTVERGSDEFRGLQEVFRQLPGPPLDPTRPLRSAALGLDPGNRDVGPERALLRLVEPCGDEPLFEPGLQGYGTG